jgi:hypothetical protein
MQKIRINIKITGYNSFTFNNGESEIEGVFTRLVDVMEDMSGTIEQGVILALGSTVILRTTDGNELLLMPESRDGVDKIIKGESCWVSVFLIPQIKAKHAGFLHYSELVKLGRGMAVVLKSTKV